LPSPGHTTLTDVGGGQFHVDSFFDVFYRIDFIGHPGGPYGGMSGSTVINQVFTPEPGSIGLIGGFAAVGLLRRRRPVP
jgi:hypothetical protein